MKHSADFLRVMTDMLHFARAEGGTQFPPMGMGLEHNTTDPDQTKLRLFVGGAFYTITAADIKREEEYERPRGLMGR